MKLETIYCNCLEEMKIKNDSGTIRIYECPNPSCKRRIVVILSNGTKIAKLEKKLDQLKNGSKKSPKTKSLEPTSKKDGRKESKHFKPCPKCAKMIETRGMYTHLKYCEGLKPKQEIKTEKRGPGRPKNTYNDIPEHVLKYTKFLSSKSSSSCSSGAYFANFLTSLNSFKRKSRTAHRMSSDRDG